MKTYYAEITKKLIAGSRNIERMKFEITLVVSTLLSIAEEAPYLFKNEKFYSSRKSRGSGFWEFSQREDDSKRFLVTWISVRGNFSYTSEAPDQIPLVAVKTLHADLPYLVKAITENCGVEQIDGFRKKLEPLLEASDVVFN